MATVFALVFSWGWWGLCILTAALVFQNSSFSPMPFAFVVSGEGTIHLVRSGSPVPGLAPGAVLVAAPPINGRAFAGSAVLLLRHRDHSPTFGVIINRPFPGRSLDQWSHLPTGRGVQHGDGGPMNTQSFVILHNLANDPHSIRIARGVSWCHGSADQLRRLVARDGEGAESGYDTPEEAPPRIFCLHGSAGWAPGQLEGELRANAWAWRNPSIDVLAEVVWAPNPVLEVQRRQALASDDGTNGIGARL